jgi:hypothetical protein
MKASCLFGIRNSKVETVPVVYFRSMNWDPYANWAPTGSFFHTGIAVRLALLEFVSINICVGVILSCTESLVSST